MRSCSLSILLCVTYFSVQVLRIVDGDTFEAKISIWPNQDVTTFVRVLGVDTPEVRGPHAVVGILAKDFTRQWISEPGISIHGCKFDSFGRLLGRVCRVGGECLDDVLVREGHGVRR